MASTHLTRTVSSGGNRQKWTLSFWIKFDRIKTGSLNIFSSNKVADADYSTLYLDQSKLTYYDYNGGTVNRLRTSRVFKDLNAWYHIVVRYDSTHGTADNRIRFYINGSQATDIIDRLNPAQNYNSFVNANTYKVFFGAQDGDNDGTGDRFGGSMSHIHLLDGEDRDASYFGETDSTTGEWKIKTNPTGINYGTNGFFILKDGNSVTDQSGNGNNLTVGAGTLTKTEDNPSNVFATMNPLSAGSDMTFGNGNTKIRNDVATWNSGLSTIAPATGKYYWEVYVHGGGDNNTGVSLSSAYGGNHSEVDAGRVVYSRNGAIYREGLSQGNGSTGVTYGDGDYIGVAFDTENGTLSFYKNGSAVSNSTTTDTSFLRSNNEYLVQCGLYNGGEFRFNFGNGAFGSTQLTGTTYQGDGNIGIFKYQPPTGYTALSTKGLNE